MRKMIMIAILFALILFALLAIFIAFYPFHYSDNPENVQFEFVGCLPKTKAIQWDYWFMVNDLHGTDITSDILNDYCNVESINMDFEQYSYIISDGYELTDLYYIPSDGRRRFSVSPDYYGYATLQKSNDAMIYIYRIPSDTPVIKDLHAHYEDDYRTTVLQ